MVIASYNFERFWTFLRTFELPVMRYRNSANV